MPEETKCPKCGKRADYEGHFITTFECGSSNADGDFEQSVECLNFTISTLRAALSKAKEPRQYGLKAVVVPMPFADRVEVNTADEYGTRFTFRDSTGHIHGEFRVGDPIAGAPLEAIGAAKMLERWWWILSLTRAENGDL